MARPSQQGVPLGDHPVGRSVKVEDRKRRCRRLRRDQGGDGCRRRNALVEERNAEECSSEGGEDGESRLGLDRIKANISNHRELLVRGTFVKSYRRSSVAYIFSLAGDGHESAPASVKLLRSRERHGEEGRWRAKHLEPGV